MMANDGEDQISGFQNGPLQRRRARPQSWTKARRAAFLTELAHSCNVTRAHTAAGVADRKAYTLRQRDPEFARAWQQALEIGFERLETALLRRALEVTGALDIDIGEERREPVEKMSVEQAMALLSLHRRSVQQGQAHRRNPSARHIATQEETDAVLIKRIAMVKRQRERRERIVDGGELMAVAAPAKGSGAGGSGEA